MACIRRICERAEASNKEIHLVFLDWAEVFDKGLDEELFWALEELAFPQQYMDAIQALHDNP